MSFDSLGLRAELLRAIGEQGYDQPTPIQLRVIPEILAGNDVLAGAQTGTGKTAGFTLPLLQRLYETPPREPVAGKGAAPGRRPVRALVMTPTRELAAQVHDSIVNYGRHLKLPSAVIFGGVKINPQIAQLRRGVDILVATPGRLLDHTRQGTVDLSRVEILVLDEADRMLDMGFIHDIKKILALLPRSAGRQNLLFSATFSDEIKQLAGRLLNQPKLIEAPRCKLTAARIEHVVHVVEASRKRAALSYLIGAGNWQQVLVFTRTKHGANRLAKQLEQDGLQSLAIHGNKSQAARTRALAEFKAGATRVLVATDIAARGLDIDLLPHVVNYELPNVPEDYIHRIGRTGRAGQEGVAVSLVCREELGQLRDIERLLKRELPRQPLAGFEAETGARPAASVPRGGERRDRPRRGESRPGSPRRGQSRTERARGNDARMEQPRHGKGRPDTPRQGNAETAPQRSGYSPLAKRLFG